jgi:phosphoribosyl-ATP pyrophosphohydrolase
VSNTDNTATTDSAGSADSAGKQVSQNDTLAMLFQTITDRQQHPKPGSYTNQLLASGLDEITKKVGEEAIEVIIAAQHQGRERLISEMADLTYHCLVLLAHQGLTPQDIAAELDQRHRPR